MRSFLSSAEYDVGGGVLVDVCDVDDVDDEASLVDEVVAPLTIGVFPSFLACTSAVTSSLFSRNVFVDMP
jgi:hypothetical protein